MKKLLILVISIFAVNGIFGQSPCDAELIDTLKQEEGIERFLKAFNFESDYNSQSYREQNLLLRDSTEYRLKIGNSKNSQSDVYFKMSWSVKQKEEPEKKQQKKSAIHSMNGKKIIYTGEKKTLIKNLKIAPGEIRKIDFMPHQTTKHSITLSFEEKGNNCVQTALFFLRVKD